ncbi:hypothetical protein HYH02_007028 [Chlamydomonas schloesseri]|uniref:Uncharacterized protein n=1 Tax=Chlamydomonas schloesseri TaxID=2026947 RepID=A0A835WIC9_9CHLO|nr:hypothetical protein HYH02_007028 [Chlamydomonas schloesseri]|eukprot:KAG2448000.1 hypothetical protein HYH02_007028 [Chlamydomonas schloesseri]
MDRAPKARGRAALPAAPAPQAHEFPLYLNKQYEATTRSALPGTSLWRFGATGHTQLGFDCENAALLARHQAAPLQASSASYRPYERLGAGSWRLRGVGPAAGGRKTMTVARISAGEASRQTAFVVIRINGQLFAVSADLLVMPLEGGPGSQKQAAQQPLVTSAGDICGGSSISGVTVDGSSGGAATTTGGSGSRGGAQLMHCVLLSAAEVAPLLQAATASTAGSGSGESSGCGGDRHGVLLTPTLAHITRCDVYLGEGNLHGYLVHLQLPHQLPPLTPAVAASPAAPPAALAPQPQPRIQLQPLAAGSKQQAWQPQSRPAGKAAKPATAAAVEDVPVAAGACQQQARLQAQGFAKGLCVAQPAEGLSGGVAAVASEDEAEAAGAGTVQAAREPGAQNRQQPEALGQGWRLQSREAVGVAEACMATHVRSALHDTRDTDPADLLLQPANLLAAAATAGAASLPAAALAPSSAATAAVSTALSGEGATSASGRGTRPHHTVFVRLCRADKLLLDRHKNGDGGVVLGDGWAFEPSCAPQAPQRSTRTQGCCIRLLPPSARSPAGAGADMGADAGAGARPAGTAGCAGEHAAVADAAVLAAGAGEQRATGRSCYSRFQCSAAQAVFVAAALEEPGPAASGSSTSGSASRPGGQLLQPLWARLCVDAARGHWTLSLPADAAGQRLLGLPAPAQAQAQEKDSQPHQGQVPACGPGACPLDVCGCAAHVVTLLPPLSAGLHEGGAEGTTATGAQREQSAGGSIPADAAGSGRPVLLLTLRLRRRELEAAAGAPPAAPCSAGAPCLLLSAMAPTLPLQWALVQAVEATAAAAAAAPAAAGAFPMQVQPQAAAAASAPVREAGRLSGGRCALGAEVDDARWASGAAEVELDDAEGLTAPAGEEARMQVLQQRQQQQQQQQLPHSHHQHLPRQQSLPVPPPPQQQQHLPAHLLPTKRRAPSVEPDREACAEPGGPTVAGLGSAATAGGAGPVVAGLGASVGAEVRGHGGRHAEEQHQQWPHHRQHDRCVRARSTEPPTQLGPPALAAHAQPPHQCVQRSCPAAAQRVAAAVAAAQGQPCVSFVMEVLWPGSGKSALQPPQQAQEQVQSISGGNGDSDEECGGNTPWVASECGGEGAEGVEYRDQLAAAARVVLSLGQRLAEAEAARAELAARLEASERRLAAVRAAVWEGG